MEKNNNKEINRRDFLKIVGVSTATTVALYACAGASNDGDSARGEVPTGEMSYRTSPISGDKVSLLGYGCMRWPTIPSPDGKGEIIDQDAVNRLVDYAIEHGVNYFDTAPVYVQGFSEEATGNALKRHPRNKFFIATKLSNFSPDTHSREASLAIYHDSFRKLQVDYLDYLLLHGAGMSGMEAFESRYLTNGMLDFLQNERTSGRVRNLGFSYHGDIKVFDYLLSLHDEGRTKWDFVQIQLNYIDWKHASGVNFNADYLYAELRKRGIPSVVMEPLLGGRLSNVPQNIVVHLKQRRLQDSVASWAFRFAGSPEGVLTVLSGMTYLEHLQDNIRTYSPLVSCSDDELTLLEEMAQLILKYPAVPCTACQYCMPCPYGVDIPSLFSHYNRCVNEGNIPEGVQDADYRQARRAFLVGYDRRVPRLRQAAHCIGCGQCTHHCPQSIPIPAELHRIDRFVEQLKQEIL